MRATRKERQRHYTAPPEAADSDYNTRDEQQRDSSATRLANELARQRAQALSRVRVPKKKLPAMLWIAHQLGTIVRKGGVPC